MKFAALFRNCALGTLMLTMAACATPPGTSPFPPSEDDWQLKTSDAFTALPGQGIITGFAGFVLQRPTDRPVGIDESLNRRFIVVNPQNERWVIPMVISDPRTPRQVEGLVSSTLIPFAFQLPAGPYQIVGAETYDLTGYNSMSVGNTIVTTRYYGWVRQRLPPNGFEVRAGETTYLGRIALHEGRARFPDRDSRDRACSGRARYDTYEWAVPVWDCDFVNALAEEYPAGAASLRQSYPALNERPMTSRPVTSARGWRDWPAALAAPMVARPAGN